LQDCFARVFFFFFIFFILFGFFFLFIYFFVFLFVKRGREKRGTECVSFFFLFYFFFFFFLNDGMRTAVGPPTTIQEGVPSGKQKNQRIDRISSAQVVEDRYLPLPIRSGLPKIPERQCSIILSIFRGLILLTNASTAACSNGLGG